MEQNKEKVFIKILKENNFNYIKINDNILLENIFELFINNSNIKNIPDNDMLYLYLGIFNFIKKNYDEMKKYYLLAIEKNNMMAINNLAYYYYKEKNYEEMKKYCVMALDKNNFVLDKSIINQYLDIKFDVGFALKFKDYLTNYNYDLLNKFIIAYYKIKDVENLLNISKDKCAICYDIKYMIILKCKHSVCYECYEQI